MRRRVLILHAYSAKNRGDGLLVTHSLQVLSEALGDDLDVTLAASDPRTFDTLGIRVVNSKPSWRGYSREYLRVLTKINSFDLVVGVGGGYLRAGHLLEMIKMLVVMGPQIAAAAFSTTPSVYLPQSIGPLRFGSRRLIIPLLSRLDVVYARDDRTMREINLHNSRRVPDLAALGTSRLTGGHDINLIPVLSVRAVRGTVPPAVLALARGIHRYDAFIQSTVGGNDDRAATSQLNPQAILDADSLLCETTPRVVVAMRLHAALMALSEGHFVIHLAYERKGFGAFDDLGLSEYVHNSRAFDPDVVRAQLSGLLESQTERARYNRAVLSSASRRSDGRTEILRAVARANMP
ncbi:polysaccharide pyruvyl transferase family protein [Terrabacter sp. RAF57]|uniref:polysaccharide pyruvyl transferase family protein n=1 Tax=Terrabacter sp. RAF57 TaxID=3233063 RepID=UPI003F9A789E